MARTAVFSSRLGLLFAWSWASIEEPRASIGPMLLMVLLGIAPALLPTCRWRRLAGVGRRAAASPPRSRSTYRALVARAGSLSRAGSGFLDFYDVPVPFDGSRIRSCTASCCSRSSSSRRWRRWRLRQGCRSLAGLVLVAGAGWPATILPAHDDLGRGAFVLCFALALVAR